MLLDFMSSSIAFWYFSSPPVLKPSIIAMCEVDVFVFPKVSSIRTVGAVLISRRGVSRAFLLNKNLDFCVEKGSEG